VAKRCGAWGSQKSEPLSIIRSTRLAKGLASRWMQSTHFADGPARLATPEGEPRFAGARGGRPRAIRWALVSPVGAAPTASTAAKTARKRVNFIVVMEAFE